MKCESNSLENLKILSVVIGVSTVRGGVIAKPILCHFQGLAAIELIKYSVQEQHVVLRRMHDCGRK